jgi:hypothetical protein
VENGAEENISQSGHDKVTRSAANAKGSSRPFFPLLIIPSPSHRPPVRAKTSWRPLPVLSEDLSQQEAGDGAHFRRRVMGTAVRHQAPAAVELVATCGPLERGRGCRL